MWDYLIMFIYRKVPIRSTSPIPFPQCGCTHICSAHTQLPQKNQEQTKKKAQEMWAQGVNNPRFSHPSISYIYNTSQMETNTTGEETKAQKFSNLSGF